MIRKVLISLAAIIVAIICMSSCQFESKILCIRTSENAAQCSTLKLNYNCNICQPLSSYVLNVSKYFTSNVTVILAMGEHCLYVPPNDYGENIMNLTGVSNFTMKGLGNISYNPSEGAIQPSSVITCSCYRSQNRSGILFYKSNAIHIESLTIEDCGTAFVPSRSIININFTLISTLTFIVSYDIKLSQICINKSMGYGLDAAHIFGNFTISNSSFLRSVAYQMKVNGIHKCFGGNAMFRYSRLHQSENSVHMPLRTHLLIEHSHFLHFRQNKNSAIPELHSRGGLSMFIYLPKVNIEINHIKAMYNVGGNVMIRVNDYHENTSSVTINKSTIAHGLAEVGGGLDIWVGDNGTQHQHNGFIVDHSILSVVLILNTKFINNSAIERGGGVYISHYERSFTDNIKRRISFLNCQFVGNSIIGKHGAFGAAVYIFKHKIPDTVPHILHLFSFSFINCTFEYNKVIDNNGIINFVLTNGVLIKDSNFTFNEGTAIFLQNSIVEFSGHIIFKNNTAMHGGALKFCQSSMMYLPGSHAKVHIDFINNSATSTGGAIYVQEQCAETVPPCFFQLASRMNYPISNLINMTLQFTDNVARLAGDAIYGGQIDYCYMISYKTHVSRVIFARIFDFTQQSNISQSTISSTPYGACFCNISGGIVGTPFCGNISYNGSVIAGQKINIGVAAVGQRNGTVPTISVNFEFNSMPYRSSNTTQLIINDTFQVNYQRTRCNILDCTIYSNKNTAIFKLTLQQTNPVKISYSQYRQPYLTVSIKECPWGFILSSSPPYKCICDNLLANFQIDISCTIDTQTITILGGHNYWLGCSSSNGSSCRGLSLAVRCLLGYCKAETISILLETLDRQCSDGRQGVLCGHCKNGYSLALGTSRCLPKCPDYLFYIILIVFAVSGLLLILFLIACNFTVSEGTINGLLFYAHVVHKNADTFFPASAESICRVFIAWLNLDLGLEVCFYKSMTQYQKAWIQSGFLFYLCILEVAIIILSCKYIFFTRLFGRNVVKVLATLFLICCAKMVDIGITSLEFAHIRSSEGTNTVVWLFDGNVSYLRGKHLPLLVLGSIFYSFALVYTVILLFIQCLQRRSNICCLRWVERWRPFFEAYTSPCHINYRFWPGFLFFIRLTLSTFGSVLRDKPIVNLHITTAACVVVLIFAFVSPTGVYKHWPLNVLEFSFLVNLGILSTLVATFCHSSGPPASSFVYPSVAIAMVLFACIVLYHCMKRLMPYNCFQQFVQSVATRKAKFHGLRRYNVWKEAEQEEEAEPFLNAEQMPQVHSFSRYRETLLEEH